MHCGRAFWRVFHRKPCRVGPCRTCLIKFYNVSKTVLAIHTPRFEWSRQLGFSKCATLVHSNPELVIPDTIGTRWHPPGLSCFLPSNGRY
jgi:hypothetical protein